MHLVLIIIAIIPILGIAIQLYKNSIDIFYLPIVTLSILILFLYVFAITNNLNFGWYCITVLGYILVLKNIKFIVCEMRKYLVKKHFILILYLVPFVIVLNSIPNSYQLSFWDEFANWGMSVKYMMSKDQLYSYFKTDYFNYGHYPPAQQLLQWYFLKFVGWSELNLIKIELMFLLCIQLSLFGTQVKNYYFGGLMFLASLAIPPYFHFFYNNIYVDLLLALYFASAFIFIIKAKNSISDTLVIWLMLFIIVQIKQVGLIFALILFSGYTIKIVASNMQLTNGILSFQLNNFFKLKGIQNNQIPFFYAVFSCISIFISYLSWQFFKRINDVTSNKVESVPSLIKFFENPLSDRLRDTIHLFLIRLSESSFAIGVKFYLIILILSLSGIVLSIFINKSQRISDFLMLMVVSLGSIFYFIFVLFAYVLFFSYEEGVVLSGFERYTAIYFIGWTMVLFGYIVQKCIYTNSGKILSIIIVTSALFIVPPKDFFNVISKFNINNDVVSDRLKISKLVDLLDSIPEDSKVQFIAQGYGGLIHRIFQYSASPIHISNNCHSFGTPYHKEDLDTCQIKLEDVLDKSDYLAIYHADEKFWKANNYLLYPGSTQVSFGIYRIIRDSNNRIKLINKTE